MRMYRDCESIRRVSTEEPDNRLRELIARRILDLADYSDYELENFLKIITIEPSDAIADLDLRHQYASLLVNSDQAGIRALLTHPLDAEADAFYWRFGFEPTPLQERQLILLLKDVLPVWQKTFSKS